MLSEAPLKELRNSSLTSSVRWQSKKAEGDSGALIFSCPLEILRGHEAVHGFNGRSRLLQQFDLPSRLLLAQIVEDRSRKYLGPIVEDLPESQNLLCPHVVVHGDRAGVVGRRRCLNFKLR